ncbi:MAG: four-carbon acid sugar kinase family protein [Solobacterium sp.]|nr:four-carbon acid sugar kinase family protein [Solobacterium sp.]
MPACLVIADDLTGANATGVLLQKEGFRTYTVLNPERGRDESLSDATCLVIPTDSRSIPSQEAYDRVYHALELLKGEDIRFYSKRIDSTLRGNLGSETDAFLEALGNEYIAVCVPCFPTSGRVLCGGHLLVNGIPLDRTEVALDPKAPIHTSDAAHLFRDQSKYPVDSLTLNDIALGQEHLTKRFEEMKKDGVRIVICDAITQSDIDLIADALVASSIPFISVDPGVFTAAVGKRLIPNSTKRASGKVLCAIGSVNGVARRQVHELLKKMNVHEVILTITKVIGTSKEREEEIKRVTKEILDSDESYDVLALIGDGIDPAKVISFEEYSKRLGVSEEELSILINTAFAEVVYNVLKERRDINAIYTTGGDITAAVNDIIGTTGLYLNDEVVPLAGYGLILGGEFAGLQFISKGGMVGNDDAMVTCVKYLQEHMS